MYPHVKITQDCDRMWNGKEDCYLSVKFVNKWAAANCILLDDGNEIKGKDGILKWHESIIGNFLSCNTCLLL